MFVHLINIIACLLCSRYSFRCWINGKWWSRRTCTHFLPWELQNYTSLVNNHRRIMLDPTKKKKKKIPHVQEQRRIPRKTVGGVKLCLESNIIPTRDIQRAQTKLVCTRTQRPHRDWAITVFGCFLWRYRSAVACCRGKGRASGCSRPGYGISPLGGGCH